MQPRFPIALAVVAALGACFATYVAWIWRWVDCCVEMDSAATPAGQWQAVVAAIGLVPAFGTLLTGLLNRGRPWYWFCASVVVYAVWGLLVLAWAS